MALEICPKCRGYIPGCRHCDDGFVHIPDDRNVFPESVSMKESGEE